MPLTKKFITLAVFLLMLINLFSGCLILDFFKTTTFSLKSISISDNNGFPSLYLDFTCDGTITIKLLDPNSKLIDSDYFFVGDHTKYLYLANYRHSVVPGSYELRVYNDDNKEIYSKTIPIKDSNLSILSCQQKWWDRQIFTDKYFLFQLTLQVFNNGDVPAYPHELLLNTDAEYVYSKIIPKVIYAEQTATIESFIYKEIDNLDSDFSVNLLDYEKNTIANAIFSFNVNNLVSLNEFTWRFNNIPRKIYLPKPGCLYEYYSTLERINEKDYSFLVFDPYDDEYIGLITNEINAILTNPSEVDKINNAAAFVQGLGYKPDCEENSSYNYASYPLETLFTGKGGGDCEDLAALTAEILRFMGYNVALFLFENHLAVGVKLSEEAVPEYDHYVDGYYFLETTSEGRKVGNIPNEYKDLVSEVKVYPLTDRPLLIHTWEDGLVSIFTNTSMGNIVKVNAFVENIGNAKAESITFEAGFFTSSDSTVNSKSLTISSLEPGIKTRVSLTVSIPKNEITWFRTRVILEGNVVSEQKSIGSFP